MAKEKEEKGTPKGMVNLTKYDMEGNELFSKDYIKLEAKELLDKYGYHPLQAGVAKAKHWVKS